MALKDIFKKKKPQKAPLEQRGKKLEESKIEKPLAVSKVKREVKKFYGAWRVLKSTHVTEKASLLAGKNNYVFKVFNRTNKKEVREAVENVFGVDVIDVKIINVPSKKRRLGKITGKRPGYKKAVVKIKTGQKIEILPR